MAASRVYLEEGTKLNDSDEVAIYSQTSMKDPNAENFCGFATDTDLKCIAAILERWSTDAASHPGRK